MHDRRWHRDRPRVRSRLELHFHLGTVGEHDVGVDRAAVDRQLDGAAGRGPGQAGQAHGNVGADPVVLAALGRRPRIAPARPPRAKAVGAVLAAERVHVHEAEQQLGGAAAV